MSRTSGRRREGHEGHESYTIISPAHPDNSNVPFRDEPPPPRRGDEITALVTGNSRIAVTERASARESERERERENRALAATSGGRRVRGGRGELGEGKLRRRKSLRVLVLLVLVLAVVVLLKSDAERIQHFSIQQRGPALAEHCPRKFSGEHVAGRRRRWGREEGHGGGSGEGGKPAAGVVWK